MTESTSKIEICRDPDDDKLINCARDAQGIYIVSGDKDLLGIQEFANIYGFFYLSDSARCVMIIHAGVGGSASVQE